MPTITRKKNHVRIFRASQTRGHEKKREWRLFGEEKKKLFGHKNELSTC